MKSKFWIFCSSIQGYEVIYKGCSLRKSISPKTNHLLLDKAQLMRSTSSYKFLPWIPGREVDQKPFRRKCNRRPTCRSEWSTRWNRATHRVDDTTRSPPRGGTWYWQKYFYPQCHPSKSDKDQLPRCCRFSWALTWLAQDRSRQAGETKFHSIAFNRICKAKTICFYV